MKLNSFLFENCLNCFHIQQFVAYWMLHVPRKDIHATQKKLKWYVLDVWFVRSGLNSNSNHRTIIQTGITFKKISCYIDNTACKWWIIKKPKIYWRYVKHFWIFPREEIAQSWLVYVNKFSWIIQSCFLMETIKRI